MCDCVQLSRSLKTAVAELYQRDTQLIDARAHELAITAHLAQYLSEQLPQRDIDCDYNRDARDPHDVKRDRRCAAMRPDIVIHRRRELDENLLAVELKPYWATAERADDYEKLEDLTGDRFRYLLGVHVELGHRQAAFAWFMRGQQVDDPDG